MSIITTYCRITEQHYQINDTVVTFMNAKDFSSQIGDVYKSLALKYPKFHKMDLLAKTAFLGSELMLKENKHLANLADDEVALLFSNSESSLHSDKLFQASLDNGSPSPSQFVYTLPNILLGEIAIRNKWFGENLFLVLPQFDTKEIYDNINLLLLHEAKSVLCGWVNIDQEKKDAFFFIVEKEGLNGVELTPDNLLNLYKK